MKGQSRDQQKRDRFERYNWAFQYTGGNRLRSHYAAEHLIGPYHVPTANVHAVAVFKDEASQLTR